MNDEQTRTICLYEVCTYLVVTMLMGKGIINSASSEIGSIRFGYLPRGLFASRVTPAYFVSPDSYAPWWLAGAQSGLVGDEWSHGVSKAVW